MLFFFFFNDTATTEIYTLSLHDALPISVSEPDVDSLQPRAHSRGVRLSQPQIKTIGVIGILAAALGVILLSDVKREPAQSGARSEEHTSELQSQSNLVCRLLLEKKNNRT